MESGSAVNSFPPVAKANRDRSASLASPPKAIGKILKPSASASSGRHVVNILFSVGSPVLSLPSERFLLEPSVIAYVWGQTGEALSRPTGLFLLQAFREIHRLDQFLVSLSHLVNRGLWAAA